MKKTLLAISGTLLMICSCEKNDGKQMHTENRKPDTLAIDEQKNQIKTNDDTDYCYMNVTAKDTVLLSYRITNSNVVGKLKYKNFEKDSSSGDISGKISGDTLKVNYKFSAEGTVSEREIYFLQDSGVLLEGTGQYTETNTSKSVYKSPTAVNYNKGMRLTPADCKMVSAKLK